MKTVTPDVRRAVEIAGRKPRSFGAPSGAPVLEGGRAARRPPYEKRRPACFREPHSLYGDEPGCLAPGPEGIGEDRPYPPRVMARVHPLAGPPAWSLRRDCRIRARDQ